MDLGFNTKAAYLLKRASLPGWMAAFQGDRGDFSAGRMLFRNVSTSFKLWFWTLIWQPCQLRFRLKKIN